MTAYGDAAAAGGQRNLRAYLSLPGPSNPRQDHIPAPISPLESDNSGDEDSAMDGEDSGTPTQAAMDDSFRPSTTTNFIQRLQHVLEHPLYVNYINWNAAGTRIVIPDAEQFTTNVLSKVWRTNQFTSFIRQLNNYNFHKANRSTRSSKAVHGRGQPQAWEFEHRDFKRDVPVHWSQIRRKVNETADLGTRTAAQGALLPDVAMSFTGGSFASSTSAAYDTAAFAMQLQTLSGEHAKLKEELHETRQCLFDMWTLMQSIPGYPQVTGNEALERAIRGGLAGVNRSIDRSPGPWSAGPSDGAQQAAPFAGPSPTLDSISVSPVVQEASQAGPSAGIGAHLARSYVGRAAYGHPKLATCHGDIRHHPYPPPSGQTPPATNHRRSLSRRTAESAMPIASESPHPMSVCNPYMMGGGRSPLSFQPRWSDYPDAQQSTESQSSRNGGFSHHLGS